MFLDQHVQNERPVICDHLADGVVQVRRIADLTALAAILGPVRSVAAFTATNDPDRVNTRIGAPGFGQ